MAVLTLIPWMVYSDIQKDYNAQLDNKVDGKWTFYNRDDLPSLGISESNTMQELLNKLPVHSFLYIVSAGANYLNFKPISAGGLTIIEKEATGRARITYHRDIGTYFAVGGINDSCTFTGWKKIATVEQLTKYDLPLSTGIYSYKDAYYWKNDFGEVKVMLQIKKRTAFAHNEVVATLRAGFRPLKRIEVPATLGAITPTGGNKVGTTIFIDTDGKISVTTDTSSSISAGYAWAYFAFLVA